MDALIPLLIDHLPSVAVVCFFLASSFLFYSLLTRLKSSKFPLLDHSYDGRPERFRLFAGELYEKGYQKFRHDIHRIMTPDGEHIIVPNRYLDELRQRSDDEIDVLTAFMKALENDYLHVFPGYKNTRIVNSVVKKELTRSLVKINRGLSKTVVDAVASVLPPCDDWTSVKINRELLRMVAIISGHVFIGPELCWREEYVNAAVNFTSDITKAVPVLKAWPKWLKPIANYVEPQVAKVRLHRKRMREFLGPVVEERRAAKTRGDEMPEDTLQWILDKTDAAGVTNITDIANMQLLLTMAAIHTTTLTVTYIIFDLVSRPHLVEVCREEIRTILETTDGVMTTNALFNMKLMDSVMRESQRLNPPFLDAFRRYTLKPITLKDGTKIPSGCLIEAANKAVLMDPHLYPNPEEFDPYRFLRLRTTDAPDPISYKNREQYQFVSVTKENMSFGFGKHACPGRFFAANEIKLIMAQLLLNYDMKLPEGAPDKLKEIAVGVSTGPDPNMEITIRKVPTKS